MGGATTSGSNFPRSELREGKHTLFIDQRVTHLPDVRKHIVLGQIHDATKYLIFFRLEDNKLLISINDGERVVLNNNYKLGTRFNVKFEVENNQTKCYYNNNLKYTWDGAFSGAYVQSSCKGKKQTAEELCTAYAEVEIFDVWFKHE